MHKILIVEDDEVIAKAMKAHTQAWGYQAVCARDFGDIVGLFVAENPGLVLLDISLPFYNGYHWCNEIRKISKVPIIFISSASENMNIVMAMNMGGDDFIAKPFDLDVLMSKVQAMLRRTYDFGNDINLLEHQGIIFNLGEGNVSYAGNKIELTKNEMRILQMLMGNKGKTVTRDKLMTKLWESDSFIDDNTLTVNVARLRRRLEEIGISDFIQTKKGLGYFIPI